MSNQTIPTRFQPTPKLTQSIIAVFLKNNPKLYALAPHLIVREVRVSSDGGDAVRLRTKVSATKRVAGMPKGGAVLKFNILRSLLLEELNGVKARGINAGFVALDDSPFASDETKKALTESVPQALADIQDQLQAEQSKPAIVDEVAFIPNEQSVAEVLKP